LVGFAQAGLARVAIELEEVARLCGAGPLTVARSVHLPLMRPAVWGAALLVFVDCLKELPITLLLRPLNVETLSTYVYQFATRGSFEEGALAALLIVGVGILPVIWIVRLTETAAYDLRLAGRCGLERSQGAVQSVEQVGSTGQRFIEIRDAPVKRIPLFFLIKAQRTSFCLNSATSANFHKNRCAAITSQFQPASLFIRCRVM
jgi:Binding-protein-dependent transport system inner membrane component